DLDVGDGETLAVIGPNGAGKTTLIAQLSGDLAPDTGAIRFAGQDVTALGAPARSHRGLARSFQITSIFREFTALDNVALAVQAHAGHSFRFWRPARAERALREPAREMLARVGLAERAEVMAGALAHGEQRQLEIAMALATRPRLLLLDEPVAGMGIDESQRMVQLLRTLRGTHTMVLVEHDMDVVFALADRICVMVYGRVIATGAPEVIRANPEVRRAYLGVEPGRLVTLLGRNGMGKTTTVRATMGLLPVRAGRVRFEGRALERLPPHRIARAGLGLVPEGRQIFPNLSVRENLVATAANRRAAPAPWTVERVYELFPSLAARARSMGGTLSGGEQQMLAVGRALMTNPRLLILDEATEGLAPLVRDEIWRCLERLKADGLSILVIDKNVEVLTRLADHHYVLEKGRVVWNGTSAELRARADVQHKYLGV